MKRKQPVKKKRASVAKRTKVAKKSQRQVRGGVTVVAPMRVEVTSPEPGGSGEYIFIPGMIFGHPLVETRMGEDVPVIIGFGQIQFPE